MQCIQSEIFYGQVGRVTAERVLTHPPHAVRLTNTKRRTNTWRDANFYLTSLIHSSKHYFQGRLWSQLLRKANSTSKTE